MKSLSEQSLLQDSGESTWDNGSIFHVDPAKDRFIHFTSRENAENIIASGKLLMDPPHEKFGTDTVNAVSTQWGDFVPRTQISHQQGDIVGVTFQTGTLPDYGRVEEVVWKEDVEIKSAEIVALDAGIEMLKSAPLKIRDEDMVKYEQNVNQSENKKQLSDMSDVVDYLKGLPLEEIPKFRASAASAAMIIEPGDFEAPNSDYFTMVIDQENTHRLIQVETADADITLTTSKIMSINRELFLFEKSHTQEPQAMNAVIEP